MKKKACTENVKEKQSCRIYIKNHRLEVKVMTCATKFKVKEKCLGCTIEEQC